MENTLFSENSINLPLACNHDYEENNFFSSSNQNDRLHLENLFKSTNNNILKKLNNSDYKSRKKSKNLPEPDIDKQIQSSESTMPGLFISTMLLRGQPISEKELLECVNARIDILRKPDGAKYKLVR